MMIPANSAFFFFFFIGLFGAILCTVVAAWGAIECYRKLRFRFAPTTHSWRPVFTALAKGAATPELRERIVAVLMRLVEDDSPNAVLTEYRIAPERIGWRIRVPTAGGAALWLIDDADASLREVQLFLRAAGENPPKHFDKGIGKVTYGSWAQQLGTIVGGQTITAGKAARASAQSVILDEIEVALQAESTGTEPTHMSHGGGVVLPPREPTP